MLSYLFAVDQHRPQIVLRALLNRLHRDPSNPLRGTAVIVQWEFAAKHTAVCPATLRTTYWRGWFDVSIAPRPHPSALAPPPSVGAALGRLERRAQPRLPPEAHDAHWGFLRAACARQETSR